MVHDANRSERLRLWPGVFLPLASLGAVLLPGFIVPATRLHATSMMFGPVICLIAAGLWWVLASGSPNSARWTVPAVFVGLACVAALFVDPSMYLGIPMFGWPIAALLGTAWLYFSRGRNWDVRFRGLFAALTLGWAMTLLVRIDGIDGRVLPQFAWRWTETSEERYLAKLAATSLPARKADEVPDEIVSTETDWSGFRGPNRDSQIRNVFIETDWESSPPELIWKRPIGPGWSSFCVVGDRAWTQEQRGDQEIVLCLSASTGEELWSHSDHGRFWEVVGGAGPRATPTFANGHVFTLGANGRLNCLDAASGNVVWTSMLITGEATPPMWGFSSSPLVFDDAVVVFAGSDPNASEAAGSQRSVVAFDRSTGSRMWTGGTGNHSYSSPQLFDLEGTRQLLMVTELGVYGLDPENGSALWNHNWPISGGYRVVQPNARANHVLIGTTNDMGTRRLDLELAEGEWQVREAWTSRGLKPYFNDFVIHEGAVYGFDNSIMVCLDFETGERLWKGGRYGTGQLLLLADQDLMIVTTEKTGEVVLVQATPDAHRELARMPAIEGKSWNHPVIANGHLFVRSGEEAACFKLPTTTTAIGFNSDESDSPSPADCGLRTED